MRKPSPARSPGGGRGERRRWHLWPSWALVLAPPFVFAPAAYESFRLPKLLVSEVLALAALLFLLPRLGVGEAGRRRLAWRDVARLPALRAALPLLVAAAVSVAGSAHRLHGRDALVSLAVALAALVGWSVGLGDGERRRLLRATLLPATLLAVLVIVQYHVWNPFEFRADLRARLGLTSFAGNPFDLAAYLLLPFVVAQAELGAARGRARWPRLAVVVLLAWAVVLGQSFSPLVAAAVASLAYWLPRVPRRRLVAGLVAAAVGLGAAVAVVPPLRKRVMRKAVNLERGDLNRFLTGRLDAWRAAAWMVGEEPWTGVGHGAFRAEFGDAKLALAAAGARFERSLDEPFFTLAHNDPLQALAEWGVVGAVALLAAAASVVVHLRRRPPPADDEEARWRGVEAAVLLGVGILTLVNFPLHLALVGYPLLLLLSGVLRPPTLAAEGADAAGGVARRPLAVVLAVLLAAGLAVHARWAAARWEASRELRTVERVTAAALAAGQMPALVVRDNLRRLQRVEATLPTEVAAPMARGNQYLLSERPHAALRGYRDALAVEQRGEAWANVGRALRALGDEAAAREAFAKAVVLDHTLRRDLPAASPEPRAEDGR